MKTIFIAGTDTGVGKTVITGLLGYHLIKAGYRVVTQKWIQTGSSSFPQDLDRHIRLMRKTRYDFKGHLSFMAPYVFKDASSPHLASHLENRRIEIKKIKGCLDRLCADFDFVIVEGTGGLLVPIDEKRLLIDIVKIFNLPVLVVAENKLGAINHTLLSIEALQSREIKIIGIVFNNTKRGEKRSVKQDNPLIVKRLSGIEVLGILPNTDKSDKLHKPFASIGNKIASRLWMTG